LTGTPITNSLADLSPLLSFIRLKDYETPELYKASVLMPFKRGEISQAQEKVQLILKSCCLRRLKTDVVDGFVLGLTEIGNRSYRFQTRKSKLLTLRFRSKSVVSMIPCSRKYENGLERF
jgi:hypothetical protein